MNGVSEPVPRYEPNELLSRLIGCRLYSVQFVADYVQLRFDGESAGMPVLNCDVMPMVEIDGARYADGDTVYDDPLCR